MGNDLISGMTLVGPVNLTRIYEGKEQFIVENKMAFIPKELKGKACASETVAGELFVLKIDELRIYSSALKTKESFLTITKIKDEIVVEHLVLNFKNDDVRVDFKKCLSMAPEKTIRVYCDDSSNEISRVEAVS